MTNINEAAMDREASMRTKTGTTGTTRDADRARILVLMAEQTQRLKTEGVTCVKCGTKITLDPSNPQHYANAQQGIELSCAKCNICLVQCDTMESAGVPTELIAQAHKLVEIKRTSTATLGHHFEPDSKGQKRTCTTRERQITRTAFWRLEDEGLKNNDKEASISLIGTGDPDIIRKVLKLGEKIFCYIQENIPEIQQQAQ